jgi:hypothetical protein
VRGLILVPLARSRGLDYETEGLTPGSSEDAHAYGFVSCGADVLLYLCFVEGFPSADRRTAKRGVKWVFDGIFNSRGQIAEAQTAAIFLAQAIALNFEMMSRRSEDRHSENLQRSFRELIQRVYRLDERALERQQELTAEYRVMETHEVPREVQIGVRMGTGYHRALMDENFSEHENVDDDKHLVEIQEHYALGFLRSMANLYAIELLVGDDKLKKLEPKLLRPGEASVEMLKQQFADHTVWQSAAEDWRKHAERVISGPA